MLYLAGDVFSGLYMQSCQVAEPKNPEILYVQLYAILLLYQGKAMQVFLCYFFWSYFVKKN